MGLSAMRWVDHWVGMPACFVLGLLATALRKVGVRRSREIAGDRTLAVYKFFGLGSIIEATPLLRAIRQRYPHARLAFVTFAGNEKLLRELDVCTDIRVIRTSDPLHFVMDVLRQVVWLHRQHVEAVVDLEFFSKFSTLLMYFSGARIRIGFHLNDFWRHSLITDPVYFNYYRHITDVYRQVAWRLDTDVTDHALSRPAIGPAPRRYVERDLRARGWDGRQRLLGVNIHAGDLCLARRWPVERFAALLNALARRHDDLRFVLTGTPDERAHTLTLLDKLAPEARSRSFVVAGEWNLDQFIAGLALMAGYVTNDSGPMHFAAAVGVPMVSLWGPGRPAFYAPKVPRHETIYADYHCSPCLYMFTTFEAMWCRGEAWCMQAIEVDTVLQAVERTLQPAGAADGGGAASGR